MAFDDLLTKISTIDHINIDNKRYKITYLQGGDLKWISNMTDIVQANGNQSCIWCHWKRNSCIDFEANWRIERSHVIGESKIGLPSDRNDGYLRAPLVKFIDFTNTVVDPLHFGLRITDKQFDKLNPHIQYLSRNGGQGMQRFAKFIKEDCKVTNAITYNSETETYSLRSINQNERYKIMDCLTHKKSLMQLFPEYKDDNKLKLFNFVFCEFYELHKFIKLDHTLYFDEDSLKTRLKNWLKSFVRVTDGEKLTPYVHTFVFHVPEFITKFKNLNLFSMQALERLNSTNKARYQRRTNKKDYFMKQLLNLDNHHEFTHLEQ